MENNIYKAYAEVDMILSFMDNKYIEKIPKKMRDFFKNEKLQNYEPNINPQLPLEDQELQKKTYAILAMLNINYWCNNEEEKKELIQLYAENDKKKEEELREKYNPDNIFKKKQTENISNTGDANTSLIEYKESNFFKKILDKIMSLFKKSNKV